MLGLRGVRIGCLLAAPLAGCSGGGAEAGPLVPVEGTVTNNGEPMPNGEVTFIPEDEKVKVSPGGQIAPDGKYSLQTGGKPGAPVGKYQVTVALDDPKVPGA
jgi:hypothetical protein